MPTTAKFLLCAALFPWMSVAGAQTDPSAVMLRYPDVSAENIVFRYDTDLWLVAKEGGQARRLTSSTGGESFAKFSPDGQSVAFMSEYDGGSDLYTLALDGGVPVRATYHSDRETLCDWHPDGEQLLFFSSEVSGVRRAPKMFLVSRHGGLPRPLPMAYGTFGAIDESGEWVAYTPNSREFRTWRRYRGGMAQDVWLFNLNTNESVQFTKDPGTDSMPMWNGRNVIFLSDRGDKGIMNLYSRNIDSGTTRQLTDFSVSGVRFPSAGPDDVVFEAMGKLYRYEFDGGEVVEVPVTIPMDRPALRPAHRDLEGSTSGHAIAPQAKRVVVEARGEIFTVPVEDGVTRNLTRTSGVAERYPSWSPDGKWIAYWSDRSGEYELTLRRSDGKTFDGADENGERQLTSMGAGWKYAASWSPDSEKLCFAMQGGELYVYLMEGKELLLVDTNPTYGQLSMDWSPDSNWLAWSREHSQSHNSALQLYDLGKRDHHEVTSGMFNDSNPTFDLAGDWLFFASQRTFSPTYSEFDTTWIYTDSMNLMAVPLRTDVENPFAPSNDEEPITGEVEDEGEEGGADHDADEGEGDDDLETAEEDEPLRIDVDGFEARSIQLPVSAGSVRALKGLKGKLLYMSGGGRGRGPSGAGLRIYDLEKKKDSEVLSGVRGFDLTPSGEKLLVRVSGGTAVVSPAPDQKTEDFVDFSGVAGVFDPASEWPQLLNDVHRIYRDWFYDPNLHGVDWDGIRDRALAALDFATSREDVTFLVGEMISELNVGHAYNRPAPGETPDGPEGPRPGLLGCDWELDQGAYRIGRILGSSYDSDVRSPLSTQGVDVNAGDWLLEVNGVAVDSALAVHAAFLGTAGRETLITVNTSPSLDGNERVVVVRPMSNEGQLRYRDWVAGRRAHVEQASGGRVGYVHVPDTGRGGQNELLRQFMGQRHKDALIVDERWNGGGQIPTRFIELLDRPATNYWATRSGRAWEWPPVGHRGPKAMLINFAAGSGGDAFPYYFRQAGLGKLIGTRTWGGLVGMSGNPGLIDGAAPSVPTFGFFETDGTWGIEGHGVDPDIEVIDDPAKMLNGADPQLDTAIAHLLKELETGAHQAPDRPTYPDRSGAGISDEDK